MVGRWVHLASKDNKQFLDCFDYSLELVWVERKVSCSTGRYRQREKLKGRPWYHRSRRKAGSSLPHKARLVPSRSTAYRDEWHFLGRTRRIQAQLANLVHSREQLRLIVPCQMAPPKLSTQSTASVRLRVVYVGQAEGHCLQLRLCRVQTAQLQKKHAPR